MMRRLLAGWLLMASSAVWAQGDELVVYAAGSLRQALTEIAAAFEKSGGAPRVRLVFGASGLLLERLRDKGERADVFASANMEHPQALAAAGRAGAVRAFARNTLCALAAPTLVVSTETLIDRMLDPAVKLGTSTPKADPSGDYTWAMFERVERQPGRSGAFKALSAKALQLTGGPNSPAPPADRNVYGALVAAGQADLFITYCTNARIANTEVPALRTVALPDAINVGASYGVTAVRTDRREAEAFVAYLLAPEAQSVLARLGFSVP
jgi:ABC-type molybdate transport system substrate-binding protein